MSATTLPVTQPAVKSIFWETNYNNKLACSAFIHMDLKPTKLPERSKLLNTIIKIYTNDASHPPVDARLYDLLFIRATQIPDCLCLASHGIRASEFKLWLFEKHRLKLQQSLEVCVYQYQKILEPYR